MSKWYLNGEICDEIAIDSRGLQYGDGVFETIAIRDGEPRLWPLHVERLSRACKRMDLELPNTDDVRKIIENHSDQHGIAKIIVAARGGERGYARASGQADVLVRVYNATSLPATTYASGVEVMICETRLATGSAIAGLKTLNRLEQVLARNEVTSKGCFEGLTLDADGRLICGTMSNLFAVKDNKILTPDLSRCGVEGVMRRHIIETLAKKQRNIEIADIESLDDVDEVFLSNSQFGVLPVRTCDDSEWPVGAITREVVRHLADSGIQEWSL